MLTNAEACSEVKDGKVLPDKLTKAKHDGYLGLAADMLRIYREGSGVTRGELHEAVTVLFHGERDCPPRRIKAFCKLLDDQSEFDGAEGDSASRLRMQVFDLASSKFPLVQIPDGLLGTQRIGGKIRNRERAEASVERDRRSTLRRCDRTAPA